MAETINNSAFDLRVAALTADSLTGDLARSNLVQDDLSEYAVPFTAFRVWDDFNALPPGTAANDDLAIIEGTFGTDGKTLQGIDAGGTTETQRVGLQYTLPVEYVSGQTVQVRVRAGMLTISDGTATVDVECYKQDDDGGVGSDICATAAQSCNSQTKADLDFTITATGLAAGDVLDLRITTAVTDAGDAGADITAEISKVSLLLDVKG